MYKRNEDPFYQLNSRKPSEEHFIFITLDSQNLLKKQSLFRGSTNFLDSSIDLSI